ncbi:MAG: thioredoxin family protein [Spirochaetes bacterium]|nr:MAG: thioredoxin family protein [Spirochaetota bacterium]
MKIQILGTGCPKCKALEDNAREAIKKTGVEAEIEKITDIDRITEMGVMVTPCLAIDGKVMRTGKVLSADEIAVIIKGGN